MTCDTCRNHGEPACTCPAGVRPPLTVVQEAAYLVENARAAQHGDFARNASTTQDILYDLGIDLRATDLPLVLMALKLARHRANPTNRDNIVDAIGYLGLYARLTGLD